MEWSDDAIILAVSSYGEGDAILDVLTRTNGRQRGYLRGGASRKNKGILQSGNSIHVTWRARVANSLGRFQFEPKESRTAFLFNDSVRLTGMSSLVSLLLMVLPEREYCNEIYEALNSTLDAISDAQFSKQDCGVSLVVFELGLLGYLGFSLDLAKCAATGVTTDLLYVSPKTGRAVSVEAGEPYKEALLPLPRFLQNNRPQKENEDDAMSDQSISDGLRLTGYFLQKHVLDPLNKKLPDARGRFISLFRDEKLEGTKKE